MKKVLIAIDYNPHSEIVVQQGYELAKTMDAQICLVHVLAEVHYYGMNYPAFMGYEGYNEMQVDIEISSQLRKVAEDFLKTAADHLNDPAVTTHLAEGNTASALLDYAEEWQADLIVMGTHSHSVLEKVLMGTTASHVLEKTKVPVYMVPVKD